MSRAPDGGRPVALILAPHGRDAAVASGLLREAGLNPVVCADLGALAEAVGPETSFAVMTEEAAQGDLGPLRRWVESQPSWSDLPFVVATRRGGGPERNPAAARISEALGNVTFLERPFHPTTFASVALAALRGRRRQYEARARLAELRESEERLRSLNETLEERVAARTAELERAHEAVIEEVRQRELAEDQLRQAQKLEMIGQLTGGVAHDFNNLLTAILANLDLLRKQVPDDPKAVRLIDGALEGARRGAALTQRLLAFARRQALKVEPTDLVALLGGLRGLLHRSVGSEIEIRLDVAEGTPHALADANQLELALLNLVVNARDAMPGGGTVTIRLEEGLPPVALALPGRRYVRLAVADSGIGMDSDTLRRAVDPFFSTKEVGRGTGLGLSMVHGLAVQLGGALRLESAPDRGTVAELWLPATEDVPREAIAPAASPVPSDDRTPGGATILLVDDDALIAMSTADMLEDLGHAVVAANSGKKALALLEEDPGINLLITDYSMPGMNGAELAKAVRMLRPELPILLATGFADLPPGAGIELPRLEKPYDQHQLAGEIDRLLAASGERCRGG